MTSEGGTPAVAYADHELLAVVIACRNAVDLITLKAPLRQKAEARNLATLNCLIRVYRGMPGLRRDTPAGVSWAEATSLIRLDNILRWAYAKVRPIA